MFRYAFATLVFRLLALTLVLSSGCFNLYSGSEQLRQAEELTRQERYDEAIVIYRAHMEERLAIEERQEWENPYFRIEEGDPMFSLLQMKYGALEHGSGEVTRQSSPGIVSLSKN